VRNQSISQFVRLNYDTFVYSIKLEWAYNSFIDFDSFKFNPTHPFVTTNCHTCLELEHEERSDEIDGQLGISETERRMFE